jgi:transcriptional regulator with XRE-family HTH domain
MSTPETALAAPAYLTYDGLLTDLDIIFHDEQGKGLAFKRLKEASGISSPELAKRIGWTNIESGRKSIQGWFREDRWPGQETLRRAILALGVDRALLSDRYAQLVTVQGQDVKAIIETITRDLAWRFEEFDQLDTVFTTLTVKVVLAQGIRALSDVRSAQLFLERADKHDEERRRKANQKVHDVAGAVASWATDPYAKTETPAPLHPLDKPNNAVDGTVDNGQATLSGDSIEDV